MSVANGILTVLKAWNGICSPDEVFSVGVVCQGEDTPQAQCVKMTPDIVIAADSMCRDEDLRTLLNEGSISKSIFEL